MICAEQNNNIINYKIVIPSLLAHDLIIQVHREYGHIKSKKMNNLIGLKFEIKNCLEISQKVVEECHVCDTTGVQPCGLQRKDLSRDPTLGTLGQYFM